MFRIVLNSVGVLCWIYLAVSGRNNLPMWLCIGCGVISSLGLLAAIIRLEKIPSKLSDNDLRDKHL